MDKMYQYKSTGAEIKDLDTSKRIVTGYFSTFGVKDSYGDIVEPGAFKKSIAERKDQIFFLNQHNWSQPHGKLAMLIEDQKGLYFESNPLPNTTYSDDALKLYEAGIMTEHSIGYTTIVSEWDNNTETRYLKELKLYEGSNVTRGANPNTPFTGLKGLTIKDIDDQVKRILKAFKSGTFTDETFNLLEIALKQLQTQAVEIGKKSLVNTLEPSLDTPPIIDEPVIKSSEIINNFIKTI